MGESIPAVNIRNLTKVFRTRTVRRQFIVAVKDLSLEVQAGEIYGLIGPNGSGKSTTMKVLLGLLKPTDGTAAIFGRDSSRVDSRNSVGFLPESPYFYTHLTGAEMLAFYGKLGGLGGQELRRRVDELLALVDLDDARNRRLAAYSKGMLQRIGLAQTLIHRPRLIVLDEPTAGVDPAGSRKIRDLILEFKAEGISVILSSHLLEQVQEVCDRVGIIFRGELVREGRLSDILAIEDQTEMILKNASPELIEKVRHLIDNDSSGAALLHVGKPRTTLERLFLDATGGEERGERKEERQ
jgi:ABC-2 type transport system ATP-binding protein